MLKRVLLLALVFIWIIAFLALIWMSEFINDAPIGPQIAAIVILVSVGWAIWKLAQLLPSPPNNKSNEDLAFPAKLANPLPAISIRRSESNAVEIEANHPDNVLSWIGGQPPEMETDWPVDPVTGDKMLHYLTMSFSQLGQFVPHGTLPGAGQLSFFICRIEALAERAKGITKADFAVIEGSQEQAAKKNLSEFDFPFSPIEFVRGDGEGDLKMHSGELHQVFGLGLELQDQMAAVQDRQMFLQLGYDDAIGVNGVIQFMIYPEELQARDWQKTIAVFASD